MAYFSYSYLLSYISVIDNIHDAYNELKKKVAISRRERIAILSGILHHKNFFKIKFVGTRKLVEKRQRRFYYVIGNCYIDFTEKNTIHKKFLQGEDDGR